MTTGFDGGLSIDIVAASAGNSNRSNDQQSPMSSPGESNVDREPYSIFVVEDNRADVFLLREALQYAGVRADLRIATDGERAIAVIDEIEADIETACPALLILDLNLPKIPGSEVLEHLRKGGKCRQIPVLIVSSSDSDEDRTRTAQLGADRYFRKPSGYDEFLKVGEVVRDMLESNPVEEPSSSR